MPRLALQLARAGADRGDLEMTFVLSRQNELIGDFAFLGRNLLPLDTIDPRSLIRAIRNLSRAARHDAVVALHLDCSQSGIVAAAFGTGLPVVAVPVGGLVEQVLDGRTGVLAQAAHAPAFAKAVRRLAESASLYGSIRAHLLSTADQRSTARFLDALLACVRPTTGKVTPRAVV